MWRATRVAADAAQNMQVDAGVLLSNFDVNNPAEPADSDIISATTGDFSITCVPQTEDFFEDVNNAPNNTKEGKRITGWDCGLTVNALEATPETIALSLGASEIGSDGGVNPRVQYRIDDFKKLYWIGDMVDENKLLAVVMDDTVSTGGLSFTSTKNGKGQLALTLTPHASLEKRDQVPMAFYVLEKDDEDKRFDVKQILSHVTSDFTDSGVDSGDALEINLTAETGYVMANVAVVMGGEDVTEDVYTDSNNKIAIPAVTGEIQIVATATEG